jgi:hypothetical protein
MLHELLGAAQSVQALTTLLKSANGLANYNEIVAAVSQVNAKLMQANTVALAAQEKQAVLSAKMAELEKELVRFKNWESEAERYRLHALAPGIFAYALKPGMENGEPPHYLCANCMSKHQKALLQVSAESEFGRNYICHNCSSTLSIDFGNRAPSCIAITDYNPFD